MTAGPSARPRLAEAGLLLVVLLLVAVIAAAADTLTIRGEQVNAFLRWDNLLANVATPMSWMAIMALGATLVIISGGIDISVGSIFGLSALAAAAALQELPADAPLALALPVAAGAALGTGLLCGLINGALVVGLRLHPFIVTLGTMSVLRGFALVLANGWPISDLPPSSFFSVFAGSVLGIPTHTIWMIVILVLGGFILSRTVFGYHVYATGGNPRAARLMGINTSRVKIVNFVVAATLASHLIAEGQRCGIAGGLAEDGSPRLLLAPKAGSSHRQAILYALAEVQPGASAGYAEVLSALAAQYRRGQQWILFDHDARRAVLPSFLRGDPVPLWFRFDMDSFAGEEPGAPAPAPPAKLADGFAIARGTDLSLLFR